MARNSTQKLRIGFIGAGDIVRRRHLPGLSHEIILECQQCVNIHEFRVHEHCFLQKIKCLIFFFRFRALYELHAEQVFFIGFEVLSRCLG